MTSDVLALCSFLGFTAANPMPAAPTSSIVKMSSDLPKSHQPLRGLFGKMTATLVATDFPVIVPFWPLEEYEQKIGVLTMPTTRYRCAAYECEKLDQHPRRVYASIITAPTMTAKQTEPPAGS